MQSLQTVAADPDAAANALILSGCLEPCEAEQVAAKLMRLPEDRRLTELRSLLGYSGDD